MDLKSQSVLLGIRQSIKYELAERDKDELIVEEKPKHDIDIKSEALAILRTTEEPLSFIISDLSKLLTQKQLNQWNTKVRKRAFIKYWGSSLKYDDLGNNLGSLAKILWECHYVKLLGDDFKVLLDVFTEEDSGLFFFLSQGILFSLGRIENNIMAYAPELIKHHALLCQKSTQPWHSLMEANAWSIIARKPKNWEEDIITLKYGLWVDDINNDPDMFLKFSYIVSRTDEAQRQLAELKDILKIN